MFDVPAAIQCQMDLQSQNTLALPVTSAYFAEPDTLESLIDVISWANLQGLPIMPLGGGSNVVFCHDWPGLVIKYGERSLVIDDSLADSVLIKVAAGFEWHALVLHCVASGWFGIENLALIPGSVGAAPIQNIGAYGVELCDVLASVSGVYIETGEVFLLENAQCEFAYRDSIFKQALAGKVLITHVTLKLNKQFTAQLHYPALAAAIVNPQPSANEVLQAVISIRQSKLPDPLVIPNVGSFFKNPLVNNYHLSSLLERYPAMPYYPQANGQAKLAAGWLIEQAGWKGKSLGLVAMHAQQALVLTSQPGATAADVLRLAACVQADVAALFDVRLQIEPQVIEHV